MTLVFFSSRRRHTRFDCDWSSDVCSSDLLTNVNPGFDTRDVLAARIRLTPARFPSGAQQKLFFEDMLAAVESHAGVQSASLASTLPLSGQMSMVVFDPRTVRPDYPEPIMVLRSSSVSRSRSEEHTSELQSQSNLVCRLLLEKKKQKVDSQLSSA